MTFAFTRGGCPTEAIIAPPQVNAGASYGWNGSGTSIAANGLRNFASGPQSIGKQPTEFQSTTSSTSVLYGPNALVEHADTGTSSIVGLTAGR